MAALNVETLTAPAIEVPAEPTTPMKPSEALRLGRLLRPRRIVGNLTDGVDGACPLGAMAAAVGIHPGYVLVGLRFPELEQEWLIGCPVVFCPRSRFVFGPDPLPISTLIWHLNDSHRWSDDQIVAWLQSLGL